MRRNVIVTILASFILAVLPATVQARDITDNSRIVVDTSKAAEVKTAKDISDYLQRITGKKLEIQDHSAPADSRYTIAIGQNAYTEELTEQLKGIHSDGFIIKSAKGKLLIRGANNRATGFGVNYFLQKYCGVRWYLPLPGNLGTVVPKQKEISLAIFTDKQEPSFSVRMYGSSKEPQWVFRNMGPGRPWHIQHNFHWQVLPLNKYYKDHPEYYALIDGRREPYPGWFQPCTSNPEVIQLCIDYAVRYFDKYPDEYVVPMGLNDGQAYCECDDCLSQGDTISDRIYIFYDKIARGLQKKHPGKKVGVLVYAGTREFPSPQVLERIDLSNLAGGLPWDRTDWFVPRARKAHKNLIRGWSQKLDQFFLWDWFTFSSNSVPTMNIRVLDDIAKFARDLGNCAGLYNQTAVTKTAQILHGPHMWVYAQLGWNVDRDIEDLLDDFCNGMFGKGAPWMKEYYNLVQDVWWRQESSSVSLWSNYAASMSLFNEADMRKLRGYLKGARQEADTEDTRARVAMIADLFDLFDLTWHKSRAAREAVNFVEVKSEKDALRAEKVITGILQDQQSLKNHRQQLIDQNAPKYLRDYEALNWQMDVPWLISELIDYRIANNQQDQLKKFFNKIGELYGDFTAGNLAKEFAKIADIESLLEGKNFIINPYLKKDGYEPNGLHMYDWTYDELCPAAWYRWHPDRASHFFSAEDAQAREGIVYGIKGEGAFDCYHQILPVKPGDKFVIRGRIKPHLLVGSAKAMITVLYWNEDKKWTDGSAAFTIPAGIENDRWYKITGLVTVPPKARYIVIGLWGRSFGDTGKDSAAFDDIQLIKVNN